MSSDVESSGGPDAAGVRSRQRLPRVVCLGQVMMDVLARLPGPLAVGSDTPAPIRLVPGGSAANTAAWLAHAGAAVSFVGRVGDDALGRAALDALLLAGVDPVVDVDPLLPTGTCIVLVHPDGQRTMVPDAGANRGLDEDALPDTVLNGAGLVHVSGYSVFEAGSRPAVLRALERADAAGLPVSVDAASAAPLAAYGAHRFLDDVAAARRLLLANLEEAHVLTGRDDPEAAALALGAHVGEAVVKCGADGAVWSDGHRTHRVAAPGVAVIDSTGAGDAFAAGLLAARLRGEPVPAALVAAAALAAQAVTTVGGRPPRTPPSAD